jgi:DUF4097 and DUF4098 domain-containing protein YvlB
MKNFNFKYLLLTVMAVFIFLFNSCYLDEESVHGTLEKTFPVKEGGNLLVNTDIGSIEVDTGSEPMVSIKVFRKVRSSSRKKAERILGDFVVDMRKEGNDVMVTADYKHSRRWFSWFQSNRLSVRFVITVPAVFNVDLRTSGGKITVSDLEGEVKSRTSGGSLRFGMIKGPVYGRTSGGSIRLNGCRGEAEIRTSGGSITIGQAEGKVDAHTSGGSISVEEVQGTILASTSGGSIKARISKQPAADCRLTTSGGSITVYLLKEFKLDLDAKTSGGRVYTDFPIMVSGTISRRMLRGTVNGGGPEFYLRTSGGSINIKKTD